MHFYNPKNKRVLVLAPHTDDGELGCGGAIARFIEEGATVYYVAFSTADESVSSSFPPDQLSFEVKEATVGLGILPENLILYKYQVRMLSFSRQEILEKMIKLREEIRPDIVFLPSLLDFHQDHQTITEEGLRAFKYCTILGYELIWNNRSIDTDCFIKLEQHHLDAKIKALAHYKTQALKDYMSPRFINALAIVRGTQISVEYAESFEVIRWII